MGTLNTIYIRATTPAQDSAIMSAYPAAYTEAGSEFFAVDQDGFDPPIAGLSTELGTDVIWLAFQSGVDAFLFRHWRGGQQLRVLAYGCQTWEHVEGKPEEWERLAMFDLGVLEYLLEDADPAKAAELRRIWHFREIKAGGTEPSLNAREVARTAARYYRFPGWAFNEDA